MQHDAGHAKLQRLRRHLGHENEGDPCNNTCKGRTAAHQQPRKPTQHNSSLITTSICVLLHFNEDDGIYNDSSFRIS